MLKSVGTTQEATFNQPPYPVRLDEPDIVVCPSCGEHIPTDDVTFVCECGYGALPAAASSHLTPERKRKKRLGLSRAKPVSKPSTSREGKEVSEMTEDELLQLNERWVYWMDKLEHTLRWYAWGDEDLTQVGIINLRKTRGNVAKSATFPARI